MITRADFTQQADAYAASRPGYPREIVDRLVQHTGAKAGDAVADIGAGTGIFTRLLWERGFRVTAVEPNAAMRDKADAMPGVTWVDGTFESSGLPSESQRWVTAAQSFHWADPTRALSELHRILAPGGHFTAIYNNRRTDLNPIVAWTQEAILRNIPEWDPRYRDECSAEMLTASGLFADVVYHETPHSVIMSRERYLTLWRSNHRLYTIGGPERVTKFLAELERYLRKEGVETVDVPYLCVASTCRRT